jgi:hypothetical protein
MVGLLWYGNIQVSTGATLKHAEQYRYQKIILQEKAVEATEQKEGKRKKPEPEEQEGMSQRQHCLPEKRRADRNPECHGEQQKDAKAAGCFASKSYFTRMVGNFRGEECIFYTGAFCFNQNF